MSLFSPALAAGGPDTAVTVSGGNLTWVVIVAVIALGALAVAGWLVREVLAASQGTAKMQEIAKAVQEGAAAYLRRQFRTLGVFAFIIFWILLLLPAEDTSVRWGRSAFFLVGALFSALTGFTGMSPARAATFRFRLWRLPASSSPACISQTTAPTCGCPCTTPI